MQKDVSYTNKPTCVAGDLGKVAIGFSIKNEMPYNSTIYMSMRTYSYGKSATISNRTDLCTYPNLGFIGRDGFLYLASESGSLCPLRSDVHYLLLTSFTVPELSRRDSYVEFTPDLMVWFYASPEVASPVIGCVETGTLAEFSLSKNRSKRGALALILSIFCFVATFSLCLHGYSRRRQAAEAMKTNRLSSMIRRYNYRRSNPSGSVSLVPSLSEGRPIGGGSSSASGIGRSTSSSEPPCSKSERSGITCDASSKTSMNSGSENSGAFVPPKEPLI